MLIYVYIKDDRHQNPCPLYNFLTFSYLHRSAPLFISDAIIPEAELNVSPIKY